MQKMSRPGAKHCSPRSWELMRCLVRSRTAWQGLDSGLTPLESTDALSQSQLLLKSWCSHYEPTSCALQETDLRSCWLSGAHSWIPPAEGRLLSLTQLRILSSQSHTKLPLNSSGVAGLILDGDGTVGNNQHGLPT